MKWHRTIAVLMLTTFLGMIVIAYFIIPLGTPPSPCPTQPNTEIVVFEGSITEAPDHTQSWQLADVDPLSKG